MFDLFISHASEDKEKLVRLLAKSLKEQNLSVWFDEFTLTPGDSLRKSLDEGLKKSHYGILILSPSFFGKKWPEWELNGLVQLQNISDENRIIPVWHNVDYSDIVQYSPSLADIIAIKSDLGVDYVVQQIINVVRPEVPSLIHAHKILSELGYSPPPPTDEWWLDVIEYDGSDPNIFDWSFYVGYLPENRRKRGELLAKKAIQRRWQEIVVEENILQTTKPERLFKVIHSVPGVVDLLKDSIKHTLCYAPQITIRGFEGPFKSQIEQLYEADLLNNQNSNSEHGIALTINGKSPLCSLEFALREPDFGFYEPSFVTCQFVQGEIMGPNPRVFDYFEYLVWLLSNDSNWMPQKIREYLLKGFLDWNVWPWSDIPVRRKHKMKKTKVTGSLLRQMRDSLSNSSSFKISNDSRNDIIERINWSIELLQINDTPENIMKKFLDGGFIENCVIKYSKKIIER